jgi:excisionase family DNA binding protein
VIGSSGRGKEGGERLRTYTAEEACGLLGCKRYTNHQLIHSGQLRAFKIGRSYCVKASDLEEFIEQRMTRTNGT